MLAAVLIAPLAVPSRANLQDSLLRHRDQELATCAPFKHFGAYHCLFGGRAALLNDHAITVSGETSLLNRVQQATDRVPHGGYARRGYGAKPRRACRGSAPAPHRRVSRSF